MYKYVLIQDAKFACGTIAWAAIQNPSAVKSQCGSDGSLPTSDPSNPGGRKIDR